MLRGAGRQGLGALFVLASFWGLGLPVAALLAFKAGWGVRGLLAGLAFATVVQGAAMVAVLCRFNWQREARVALERCQTAGASSSGSSSMEGSSQLGAGDILAANEGISGGGRSEVALPERWARGGSDSLT